MSHVLLFCSDTFLKTRDRSDPFREVKSVFANRQVCLNLETSLRGTTLKDKNVALSVEESVLDALPEAVRFFSIVNNHVGDSSPPDMMRQALAKRGRTVLGPENPSATQVKIDNMSVGFFSAYFPLPRFRLSYNGAVANTLENMLRESDADHNVVNLHWGYEHTIVPAPFQRDLAHRIVDAGASVIIGHHPHVPQGWEYYRDVPIFYSLGNFNFCNYREEEDENALWGYMVQYDLDSGSVEVLPYRINDNYQPVPSSGEDRDALLKHIDNLSSQLQDIDEKTWLSAHYRKWRKSEAAVWRRLRSRSVSMFLKWLVWLLLPMQLKYYASRFLRQPSHSDDRGNRK